MNKLRCIIFLIILFSSLTNNTYSQQWYKIHQSNDMNLLYDICFLSNDRFAVDAILGVWVTSNKGRTWEHTLNTYNVLKMQSTNILYALGGLNGSFIYVSDKTGSQWKNIATESIARPYVTSIGIRDSNDIFAVGTMFGGNQPRIYRTTNAGISWNVMSESEPLYFRFLLTGPNNFLYGLHESWGFYRSTNNGASWNPSNTGITTTSFSHLVKNSQGFLYISSVDGKLFRSTDQGSSWKSITSTFSNAVNLKSLICLPTDELYVLVDSSSRFTVHKSLDGGVNWSQIGTPISWGPVNSMAVSPTGSVILMVEYNLYTNDPSFYVTNVSDNLSNVIPQYSLSQNYPNPFNPVTNIIFEINTKNHVTLEVFDVLGRIVSILVNEELNPGLYKKMFDGSNLVSGLYFYQIRYGDIHQTKRMMLMK